MWNSSSSSLSISKPQGKKKKGLGRAWAIQSQSRPFQKVQSVHGQGISWLFCLKHQLTFQTKSKGPKISGETLFWISPPTQVLETRLMTFIKTLRKEMVCTTAGVIWWQSVYEPCETFQRCIFEKWNSLKELTNTSLTAFQERPHTASRQPLAAAPMW